MNAQDIMMGSRVAHVRELKAEIERLKAENARLRTESETLRAHFDKALLSAEDLRTLPEGHWLEVWDGWNLILGAQKAAHDREELLAQAAARVEVTEGRAHVWVVFDGRDEAASRPLPGVRVSYTGGTGAHRADRFVCDYLRMAMYLSLVERIAVCTNDKDFRRDVRRLGARLADA